MLLLLGLGFRGLGFRVLTVLTVVANIAMKAVIALLSAGRLLVFLDTWCRTLWGGH